MVITLSCSSCLWIRAYLLHFLWAATRICCFWPLQRMCVWICSVANNANIQQDYVMCLSSSEYFFLLTMLLWSTVSLFRWLGSLGTPAFYFIFFAYPPVFMITVTKEEKSMFILGATELSSLTISFGCQQLQNW